MPIEWNENLETGVHIIDQQHRELIVMLNRIGRFRCGRECFVEALTELQDYVSTHFKTEEEYMVSTNYPDYECHKACHDKFVQDVEAILKKINNGAKISELGEELHDFAADWIIDHYSSEDIKLADYIKKNS